MERASRDKFLAIDMLACTIDVITQACQVDPHWADNTRRLTSSPAQNHQTPTMNHRCDKRLQRLQKKSL